MVGTVVAVTGIWAVTGAALLVTWSLIVRAVITIPVLVAEACAVTLLSGMWYTHVTVTGIWAVAGVTGWVTLTDVHLTGFAFPVIIADTVAVDVPAGVLNTVLTIRIGVSAASANTS